MSPDRVTGRGGKLTRRLHSSGVSIGWGTHRTRPGPALRGVTVSWGSVVSGFMPALCGHSLVRVTHILSCGCEECGDVLSRKRHGLIVVQKDHFGRWCRLYRMEWKRRVSRPGDCLSTLPFYLRLQLRHHLLP